MMSDLNKTQIAENVTYVSALRHKMERIQSTSHYYSLKI